MKYLINLIVVVSLIVSHSTLACSSFQNLSIHGKSYDWHFGDGQIIWNPSGLAKKSLVLGQDRPAVKWKSKYSSLTFNQYGLEFPNGGINDSGLSVEILWLDQSEYPIVDDRPILNELQWIQYILDTQDSIEGVKQAVSEIRIEPVYAKVHYIVCEFKERCLTVEFVNGKAYLGHHKETGFKAITNSTYENSVRYISKFENFGGNRKINWSGYSSLDRYVRLNELMRSYKNQDPIQYAFMMLNKVKKEGYTQWQIVYDKPNKKVYFKTDFGNEDLAQIDLTTFNLGCDKRVFFDLDNSTRGNISGEFKTLNPDVNYSHVKKTLLKIMPQAPEEMIQAIAYAPYRFKCEVTEAQ